MTRLYRRRTGLMIAGAVLARAASASVITAADSYYTNAVFGYQILPPEGWVAEEHSQAVPEHGLAFQREGRRIWIDGSYDALLLGSAEAAAADLMHRVPEATSVEQSIVRLGGLQARQIGFTSPKSHLPGSEVMVDRNIRVVAYRPDQKPEEVGLIYSLGLLTNADHFGSDSESFRKMLDSFKLLPPGMPNGLPGNLPNYQVHGPEDPNRDRLRPRL
jgi:hypothetical protein